MRRRAAHLNGRTMRHPADVDQLRCHMVAVNSTCVGGSVTEFRFPPTKRVISALTMFPLSVAKQNF